jgi:hypothetical protein
VSRTSCADEVDVAAIISGTPLFWKTQAAALRGDHRVGIGLRTSYDMDKARLADWSGYGLPRDLANISGPLPEHPTPSNRVTVSTGVDASTGAQWFVATIRDWGRHWTPLVLTFKARLTSRRGSARVTSFCQSSWASTLPPWAMRILRQPEPPAFSV